MSQRQMSRLQRIAAGNRPRVLDLFSGCGGISLGFESAGFEIIGGIESDLRAAQTHMIAFHSGGLPNALATPTHDVTAPPAETLESIGISDPAGEIDILVGGPPCQAFAKIGRAKLRNLAQQPDAYLHDPRARLYTSYLRYVETVRPLAILMENVPDLMNYGGRNLAEEICADLNEKFGYRAGYSILNSAWYGVPQLRERCFIVALSDELSGQYQFPNPSHHVALPAGYRQFRDRARRHAIRSEGDLFAASSYFVDIQEPSPDLPPAVTVQEALADLPELRGHLDQDLPDNPRSLADKITYRSDISPSAFALKMRAWEGRVSNGRTDAHITRLLPRDYRIFREMREGDDYPAAFKLAEQLFEAHLKELRGAGVPEPERGSAAWEKDRASFVPPYDPGKFRDKWYKLRSDFPSRTLTAHIGKDTYSHIHYDSDQARTITVREAARLQSFPDAFSFCGSMNSAFRMIGNSVPPLMAEALASMLKESLLYQNTDQHYFPAAE